MNWKTRKNSWLLLWLCMSLFACLISVNAVSAYDSSFADLPVWKANENKPSETIVTMYVEAGQTFSMSKVCMNKYYSDDAMFKSYVSGKWSSSNSSVASVKGKYGDVTAKKAGKADISVTFHKTRYTCHLVVKKKGTILKGDYRKLAAYQTKLLKYQKTKITKNNFEEVYKAWDAYYSYVRKLESNNKWQDGLNSKNLNTILFQPLTREEDKVTQNLKAFSKKYLKKAFTVSKITTAYPKALLTVTLSKKVTQLQYDALMVLLDDGWEADPVPKVEYALYEKAKRKHCYYENADSDWKFKPGSRKVEVICHGDYEDLSLVQKGNTLVFTDNWNYGIFANIKNKEFVVR